MAERRYDTRPEKDGLARAGWRAKSLSVRSSVSHRRKSAGPAESAGSAARLPIEAEILGVVQEQGPICIEQLTRALPGYSWRQVFHAVDALRRDAALAVAQPEESSCRISLSRGARC